MGGGGQQGRGFTGSPCIVNYDGAEIIYAHGDDQGIYSRNRVNGVWAPWSKVQLDGSIVAPRSGIGCSEGKGDIYLVGLSASPMGEMLFAEGNPVQFGGFEHELGVETFSPPAASISSAAGQDRFYLIGAMDDGPQLWMVDGSTFTQLTPISSQTTPFVSAIDVALQADNPVWLRVVAGFEKSGQLGIYDNVLNAGSGSWGSPLYVPPPANHVYAFSPAVCADQSGTNHDVHLAVVTEGGEVWDSFQTALGASSSFSPWELVGQGAGSAVDCTIMSDFTVRIVALNADGRALEIQGSPGSWVQADLGTY